MPAPVGCLASVIRLPTSDGLVFPIDHGNFGVFRLGSPGDVQRDMTPLFVRWVLGVPGFEKLEDFAVHRINNFAGCPVVFHYRFPIEINYLVFLILGSIDNGPALLLALPSQNCVCDPSRAGITRQVLQVPTRNIETLEPFQEIILGLLRPLAK